ncbi:MAG: 3-hydroxyacyl-CoA dehydrogenase [Alphaproteobacteria bacterium]|nr:3-hydroxyacyl-CoA dehydrogenase [Alphaproteobacteria bacterium]
MTQAKALPSTTIVGVLGAGTVGRSVAQTALAAGHPVMLYDVSAEQRGAAKLAIVAAMEELAKRGKAKDAAQRLFVIDKPDALSKAGLVIEAVAEDLAAKRSLLATVEPSVGPDTIFGTCTAALSIAAIGSALKRPERLLGLHLFNPSPIGSLIEVVNGIATAEEVMAVAEATMSAWGKTPVRSAATPGFIVSRVALPYQTEAIRILEDGGADAATIDAVLVEAGGFATGPFALMDKIGNDLSYGTATTIYRANEEDPRYRPTNLQQTLVEAGWLGKRTGRGWFDYAGGAAPPMPKDAPPGRKPTSVHVEGEPGDWEAFLARLARGGVEVRRKDFDIGPMRLFLDDVVIQPTDGRMATQVAASEEAFNVVLFDLALDPATTTRVALATAAQCSQDAQALAVGLFQAAGLAVSLIGDLPGLIVARTVAMMANEACDAVLKGVAPSETIDNAVTLGLESPLGPLAWGDSLGAGKLLEILDNLRAATGEERYRASLYLRRQALAKGTLL